MYLNDFRNARKVGSEIINKKPIQFSQSFSDIYGGKVYLEPENLQKTGYFKIRGAYNYISELSQIERDIITYYSGNHS